MGQLLFLANYAQCLQIDSTGYVCVYAPADDLFGYRDSCYIQFWENKNYFDTFVRFNSIF